MTKMLAICGALLVAALLTLSDPAGAAQPRPDGYRNNDQIEVSAARRQRRVYRYHRRWGPGPYYGYGPYSRPYYHPQPWPLPFVGPFWW